MIPCIWAADISVTELHNIYFDQYVQFSYLYACLEWWDVWKRLANQKLLVCSCLVRPYIHGKTNEAQTHHFGDVGTLLIT